MKKVLLFVTTLALIVGCFAVTASAGNDTMAACKAGAIAGNVPTDICATCYNALLGNGAGDLTTCICKNVALEDPESFAAQFGNQGQCIKYFHSLGL